MAIRPQVLAGSKVTAADKSIYTHTNNVQDPKPMTGDLDLKNNQQDTQDLMVDPDHTPGTNDNECIYTHDNNDKDVKAEKGSSAARNDKNPGKVKANADDGPGPGATTDGGGESPAQKMVPDDTINISTIPNDVNPLDGYPLKDNCAPGVLAEPGAKVEGETDLENNQQGEQKLDVEANALTVANQGGPGATTNQGAGTPQNMAPLIADDEAGEEEEWEETTNPMETPPAGPEGEPGLAPAAPAVPAPAAVPPVAAPAPAVAPAVAPLPTPPVAPIVAPAPVPGPADAPLPMNLGVGEGDAFEGEDVMSILDADGIDDGDCGGMAFAEVQAGTIAVLKDLRIIASMSAEQAVKAGAGEHYMSDQFFEVATAECQRYGLRAGLESMGYVLSEVNIGRNDIIEARVHAHVEKRTEEVRAQFADKDTSFGHCLAIASVGINRNFWQDVPNELRAALENQLTAAGLRNAGKVVREVFAQYGTSYAKAIVAMANKLSQMSEQTRNELAAALDMVNASGKFEDVMDDSSSEVHASVQSDEDEYDTPTSVMAALSFAGRPARERGVLLTPKQTGYSVTAAAVLNSDELLFNR